MYSVLSLAGLSYVAACVVLNSIGQILLKRYSLSLTDGGGVGEVLAQSWQSGHLLALFVPGVACYGLGMVLWIMALRELPLHLAYPFIGLSFIIVPVLASTFVGEPLKMQTLLGGALIIAGIAVSSLGYAK